MKRKNWSLGVNKINLSQHLLSFQGAKSNWRPCLLLGRSSDKFAWVIPIRQWSDVRGETPALACKWGLPGAELTGETLKRVKKKKKKTPERMLQIQEDRVKTDILLPPFVFFMIEMICSPKGISRSSLFILKL